jgi:hypothetical protein
MNIDGIIHDIMQIPLLPVLVVIALLVPAMIIAALYTVYKDCTISRSRKR